MSHSPPLSVRLSDEDAERVRRSHEEKIRELQTSPAIGLRVIPDVRLPDSVATTIAHGLGRIPQWVRESCPRGATSSGRVEEVRDGSADRRHFVILKATGWGATITVDVAVF